MLVRSLRVELEFDTSPPADPVTAQAFGGAAAAEREEAWNDPSNGAGAGWQEAIIPLLVNLLTEWLKKRRAG